MISEATYREALPPLHVFEDYLVLLPFIEQDGAGKYYFNQTVNAHSIFF